ncbi:hypothetical protein ARMGADRAFT_1028463 [Armillaria gallica]|uniref:Uncharacterized protein n=1 Tax=Armillaria gallica TaxID=47427 RepID=A0A2H3E109_ARMGA|nr:hypothetical protein ARMGADRAFT_1028463 [Armillaria gallica]
MWTTPKKQCNCSPGGARQENLEYIFISDLTVSGLKDVDDADNKYKFEEEEYMEDFWRGLDKAESNAIANPFFNPLAGAISNVESNNDDALDSQNDDKTPQVTGNEIAELVPVPNRPNSEYKAWFEKLKYMQDWLHQYFAAVIHPLIHNKNGGKALPAQTVGNHFKKMVHCPHVVQLTLKIHSTSLLGLITVIMAAILISMGGVNT